MAEVVYTPYFTAKDTVYPAVPSKIDWERLCFFYGKTIYRSAFAFNNNQVAELYTVPENTVFLLISASVTMSSNDTGHTSSWMRIENSGEAGYSSNNLIRVAAWEHGQGFGNYAGCMPLIIRSGYRIVIFNENPTNNTFGNICGYEIPENLFNTLL